LNLPPLREELRLTEGPRSHEGQPGWTLHDPAHNRFFRLDWPTFEILKRWTVGSPEVIARLIAEQTTLRPTPEEINAVLEFVHTNQLLKLAGADNSATLAAMHARARPNVWQWLVHNYLFFRIPLINPTKILQRFDRWFAFLFRPAFWWITAVALVSGLILLARHWAEFTGAWVDFSNFHGFIGYFFVLVGIKVFHEFGHGLVATHYGCRVPTMGLAFLVMTPVAYTDTNDAWLLTRRKPRILIGAAGIITELTLAAWATLAWGLLPDGLLRSAAYMVATITWIKSVLVNISPVMRFDGYYLLSDSLDVPNLHTRCFALARWQLREWLFALGVPPPEYFRRSLRTGLVTLAFAIWLYRLVVFVGIAIFVYHFFFKALGIVLFAIEISWFVVLPILSEMKAWYFNRKAILAAPRTPWAIAAALVVLVIVCIPLPQRIRVAGQLYPKNEFRVVTSESSRLVELPFANATPVPAGATLVRLESPALVQRHALAVAHKTMLEAQIKSASADASMRGRLPVMQAELATAQASVRETEVALERLTPVAPFAGTFYLTDDDLNPDEWLGRDEHIGVLVGQGSWSVVAYLDERYTHLVKEGLRARFYPDGGNRHPLDLKVTTIELDATRVLTHPMLTTIAGGDVQALQMEADLVPEKAVYRITFEAQSTPDQIDTHVGRGRVIISAGSESILARGVRNGLSILWREFGF
jgi:putative peptide zinc metalloprotease protein